MKTLMGFPSFDLGQGSQHLETSAAPNPTPQATQTTLL
jgi:hypothetical protein